MVSGFARCDATGCAGPSSLQDRLATQDDVHLATQDIFRDVAARRGAEEDLLRIGVVVVVPGIAVRRALCRPADLREGLLHAASAWSVRDVHEAEVERHAHGSFWK